MSIVHLFRNNSKVYNQLRKMKKRIHYVYSTSGRHTFINRQREENKLCIVLAGYKSFLYDDVFGRLAKFIPKDIDVCIVSSGKYDCALDKIAENNGWSYLFTKRNSVSLAQNIAISLHPKAEYIYKMDEDIFVTEDVFRSMMRTYEHVNEFEQYRVGFVAPLIPINGYGHMRILERLGLLSTYQEKYERPKYQAGKARMIESNPEVAKFFWGEGNYVPSIDELNRRFTAEKINYSICPIRFSIGFILFHRDVWKEMGTWKVTMNVGMGIDEKQICEHCIISSRVIVIDENSVVGHLSFGPQNQAMKEYYFQNKGVFSADQQ